MRSASRVWIVNDERERFFGRGPSALLRAVEETGSLRKAAASMGMAYSKASHIVHHAEEELGFALIEGHTGGTAGGGSRLTKEGRHFLECYEAYRDEVSAASEKMFRTHFRDYLPVRIVIMASGHSRRYGSNKLLTKIDGETMIHRTMSIIPEEMRRHTIVVTRYPVIAQEAENLGIAVRIHNRPDQSDTIEIGLENADHTKGCMFVPADQPWLTRESIQRLVETFTEYPEEIVRLAWKGKTGAPVVFPAGCYEALRTLTGDTGGRKVIRESGRTVHLVEAQNEQELSDIDRPEDI